MDDDFPPLKPEKPRFLLPDGCKDLIDALRLQQRAEEAPEWDVPRPLPSSVALPDPVEVRELAAALDLKPFQIISTLMELNVFCSVNARISFEIAWVVCQRHGVAAMRAAAE